MARAPHFSAWAASSRASMTLFEPTWTMKRRDEPFVTFAQRSAIRMRSAVVREWLSPVLPQMKAV